MALKPLILLLIEFTFVIYTVKSCAVNCSTDYETLLNCSCTGSVPTKPLLLQVHCRLEDLIVNASCMVSAQQPYCVMYPQDMWEVSDYETECRASAVQDENHTMITEDVSVWLLRDVVRPWPPINIRVRNTSGSYNISWDNKNNPIFCLSYRVRIQSSHPIELSPSPEECLTAPDLVHSLDSVYTLESTDPFVLLKHSRLRPFACYRVDVQAGLCSTCGYRGLWSEWSAATSWVTAAAAGSTPAEGISGYYWLITLPILMVLLSLSITKKMFWQKRLQVMTYIPNPSEFFKPLYNSYQGNFKAWVMPVFTEHDFLRIDSMVDASTDKRLDQWNQNTLPQTPPPPYDSIPSQSPSQSRGSSHVSIHTVTLCGEDDLSHCSLSLGYPHEPGCEMCSAGREQARYSEESQSVVLMLNKNLESLDLSLSSLNLTQELDKDVLLSGDGYPHIDLDTIDSGFGECSSPAASGPSAELCEHYQSNYVKQWTISHDSG